VILKSALKLNITGPWPPRWTTHQLRSSDRAIPAQPLSGEVLRPADQAVHGTSRQRALHAKTFDFSAISH
jgi:hypothetical protein